MTYSKEAWTEETIYQFKMKNAKIPRIALPEGYRMVKGELNNISPKELVRFGKIYGGRNQGRVKNFYQKIGKKNDFFMIWLWFDIEERGKIISELVGSSLVIMEPDKSSRIEWSNVLPAHRKKGLYRNMQYLALRELRKKKIRILKFGLSEEWLLPFWLKVFGLKKKRTGSK